MKLHDLFEARNYQDIDDYADQWLAKYTYENSNRNPSSNILEILIKRYPFDGNIIYRGMNFNSEQQWNEFYETIKDGILITNRITSWSPDEEEAEVFALTTPSYDLPSLQTIKNYGEAEKLGEKITGYCGIILSMHPPKNACIDVDKSNLGHESEVIVIPGTYQVSIKKLKKFSEDVVDKDINEIILNSKKEDYNYNNKNIVNYILKNHETELSEKAQEHIFKLLYPSKIFSYTVDKIPNYAFDFITEGDLELKFYYPGEFFDLYKQGIFNNTKIVKQIKALGKKIILEAIPIIIKYLPDTMNTNISRLLYLAELCDCSNILMKTVKPIISKKYNDLNDEVRKINKIDDRKEKEKAIKIHGLKMGKILDMIR